MVSLKINDIIGKYGYMFYEEFLVFSGDEKIGVTWIFVSDSSIINNFFVEINFLR